MKKIAVFTIFWICLSCENKTQKQTEFEIDKNKVVTKSEFKEKEELLNDTLISELNIRIKIYGLNPIRSQMYDTKKILVYKNDLLENSMVIKKNEINNKLDEKYLNESFLNLLEIEGYKRESNELEFFGTLTKEDTDSTYPFLIGYSIDENEFRYKEFVEEKI